MRPLSPVYEMLTYTFFIPTRGGDNYWRLQRRYAAYYLTVRNLKESVEDAIRAS